MHRITEHIFLHEDCCNVYAVQNGEHAVLIDFGSGSILRELPKIGIHTVDGILVTHHHRDQVQGLKLAEQAKIPVYVPHAEQELVAGANQMWQAREIYNNYNNRQDRFSILESVRIADTIKDYSRFEIGGFSFEVLPTPGHTTGSVSLLLQLEDLLYAFTGDLIYAPGKVWSLAATQWSYNGGEGIPFSILSLLSLQEKGVQTLLPSHGKPMEASAIPETVENLRRLLSFRRHNPRLFLLRETPYEAITPHLLFNRTSMSNSYVLISESKKALILDLGYDFMAGCASGTDRSSRRPWLYTLPALFRDFGVERIDACLSTHYHDDHVAGFNLLRDTYGAQVWCAESFADLLEHPSRYDLPCLWYDPIPVDKRLPLDTPVVWEEYTLVLHPLSGHTRYSVAIEFEADQKKVLCGGDQYGDEDGLACNYVYKNSFDHTDFADSAALYRRIKPDLILTGHWMEFVKDSSYFDRIARRGEELSRLHEALLPYEDYLAPSADFCLEIYPFQACVRPCEKLDITVRAFNPLPQSCLLTCRLALPEGCLCETPVQEQTAAAREAVFLHFTIQAPCICSRRLRIGCDLTAKDRFLGQQAEMLLTVSEVKEK